MTRRLVLFDIDGTILHGGKLWAECFMASFKECCPDGELRKIPFSGKTDRQICRELMQAAGLWSAGIAPGESPAHEERIDAILRGYLDRCKASAVSRAGEVKLLPGIERLIGALKERPELSLGLLTGNVREGAALKLASVGLGEHFGFGVFGDDHWDRYELPAIAVARARRELGLEFAGKQVVIIGDTIHDVGCGQSISARAIGVGTGHPEARARVFAAWQGRCPEDPRPDHYFEDLSEVAAVLKAILG